MPIIVRRLLAPCRWMLALGLVLLAGCSSLPAPEFSEQYESCRQRLLGVAGVRDAIEGARPDVQPYFVIDRLHAHFDVAALSPEAFTLWRQRVVAHSARVLTARAGGAFSSQRLRDCLQQLAAHTPRAHWAEYTAFARERDLYHDFKRVVGLYPLAAPIAMARIEAEQTRWRRHYRGPFSGELTRYAPEDASNEPAPMAAWSGSDALGLPALGEDDWRRLEHLHAPTLRVYARSQADRPGSVAGVDGQAIFRRDPVRAYVSRSFARLDGAWHAQIGYTYWFERRPKRGPLDPYGGRWNGFTWRVTLDDSGRLLVAESLHNCGCYHQVWLGEGWQPAADIDGEAPLFLPLDWSGRAQLTVTHTDHYVRDVKAASHGGDETYQLVAYAQLDRLSDPNSPGQAPISLFDEDGLVPGSQRLERFFLWPFGVDSPGAMRRLGTHAIAFVGKRYFDDPSLLESLIQRADITTTATGETP